MLRKRKAVEEDEPFPRGRPQVSEEEAKARAEASRASRPPEKPREGKKRKVKPDDEEEATGPELIRADKRLVFAELVPGTLLMAAVRDVSEDELTLNLPFNMTGYVLHAQAFEAGSKAAESKLREHYVRGQLVIAVVVAVVQLAKGSKQRAELSLRPSIANAGLDADGLKPNMFLPATVEDEEEHVFRLSFGLSDLQGVLPRAEAPNAQRGEIIHVSVKAVTSASGTVRCTTAAGEVLGSDPLKPDLVKAGFLVKGRVDQIFTAASKPKASEAESGGENKGVVANFCGPLQGLLHWHHQGKGAGSSADLKRKDLVQARVLAVVPGPQVMVYLTLLPNLVEWNSSATSVTKIKIGDRLKGEIVDQVPRFGCRLLCTPAEGSGEEKPFLAFCPGFRIVDKDCELPTEAEKIGKAVPCRAIAYNFLEGTVSGTRRPYDLQGDTLISVTELNPGQLVVGVIESIKEYGAFVRLSEYVSGLVTLRHLTDVPLATVSKKFKEGDKLKCRVLRVLPDRHQVNLTAKKTLVRDEFQLASMVQARKEMLVTGFVSNVKEYGAIVSFYGDVYGVIPTEEMDQDEAPALGMAVKCRISRVNVKKKRLGLSLDLAGGLSPAELEAAGDKPDAGAIPGEVTTPLIPLRWTEEGIFVNYRTKNGGDEDIEGFIPVAHLSDDLTQAAAIHLALASKLGKAKAKDGEKTKKLASYDPLGDGVVLARHYHLEKSESGKGSPGTSLVSLKPSLKLAVADGGFMTDFSEVEEARIYTGYVRQVHDFGAIVSLGKWKVAGMVPKHLISEHFVEKPSSELSPGQTVRALVTSIDAEKHRFTIDLRSTSARPADSAVLQREAEAVRLFFKEQAKLIALPEASGTRWISLLPGTVVEAKVTSVEKYGALLELPEHEGLTALVLKENMPEGTLLRKGDPVRCCVLDMDVERKIVDLSLQPELLAATAPTPAVSSGTGKKKRNKASGESSQRFQASQEIAVMQALQKPAYSVYWCKEPPAVVFAPPWIRQRWTGFRNTFIHSLPEESGVFSRIIVRCPVKGGASNKVRMPKILRPAEELQVGSPVTMRVLSLTKMQAHCSAPVGLRGHLHSTQILDSGSATGQQPLDTLEKGSTVEARVLQMRKHGENSKGDVWHIELTCRPSLMQALDQSVYAKEVLRWPNLKKGRRLQVVVTEVRKNYLWAEVAAGIRGQVSVLDATDDLSVIHKMVSHFQVGQVFEAQVLRSLASQKKLDLAFHGEVMEPAKKGRVIAQLAKIETLNSSGTVASFRLPGKRRGGVHITELFDFWAQFPMKRLKPGTFYEACVLQGETEKEGSWVQLSLRSSAVYGTAEGPEEKRPAQADDLRVGQRVSGYVLSAGEKGVFVALSRTLVARIRLKALSEHIVMKDAVSRLHPVGELIKDALVTEVHLDTGKVELSLRRADGSGKLTAAQLTVGDVVSGRVKAVETYGIFVRLDNSNVDGLIHKSQVSDSASVSVDSFKPGDVIKRAKVTKVEGNKLSLGIKASLFDDDEMDAEDEDEDDDEDEAEDEAEAEAEAEKEAEKEEKAAEDEDEAEDGAAKSKRKRKERADKAKPDAEAGAEVGAANLDSDEEVPWRRAGAGSQPNARTAFEFAEFHAGGESDSEEENEEDELDDDDARKRPSKRQKKAMKHAEAEEIRRREAENADGQWARDPGSVEDFERLLLTEGDTSIIWIRYMAFHLKMSDLEKARQVAERAVKHVGFAEAKERFNVWVAFMNLECTFGTEKTAEAVFKRAASHNDSKQVHMQLARIHERNKKPALATQIHELCCRKFPHSKKVWLAMLAFFYREGDLEAGRKTLPKCLAVLPRKKLPLVTSQAALLEYRHGSAERGRSIFEGLLDSYPKRTDLWSVYIDAHIKAYTPPKVAKANLAEIRALLERCCTMRLKSVKMRFFFKRWLDVEKRWGDAESQELVREKARSFVESLAA